MTREEIIRVKMPLSLHKHILNDLVRPHPHAHERVGFLYASYIRLSDNENILLCKEYLPVSDEHYIKDKNVGAKISSDAIRASMQHVLDTGYSCFHIHLHDHPGKPSPSGTDSKSLPAVVQSMITVGNGQPHGIIIFSANSFYAEVTINKKVIAPKLISVVGYPMLFTFQKRVGTRRSKIYDRQSFLGKDAQFLCENVKVGIIGYGGGGSHIGQQLAHIGFKNVVVFDDDKVEDTNMNRLIGAWLRDVKNKLLKIKVAQRVFDKILGKHNLKTVPSRWQQNPELLQTCDIVVGCVDSFEERSQLEAECRRYLIPYIDIGMDVHSNKTDANIFGQVILSMPGMSCMRCTGFITEEKLGREAAKYGDVGGLPQVVWSNGVLASTAVGVIVDLITGWTKQNDRMVYLAYDGNIGTLVKHPRLDYTPPNCEHYPLSNIGAVIFKKI